MLGSSFPRMAARRSGGERMEGRQQWMRKSGIPRPSSKRIYVDKYVVCT